MSLNCMEIEEVVKTLPKSGIIKNFSQISKNALVISYYDKNGNYNLLIDARDKTNRICLIPGNIKIKAGSFKFAQFLNASAAGGKIKNISQFYFQRIVVLDIEYNGETKKIVSRLWGNGGNILLIDQDNFIVECLKRFPKREEWPDEEFVLKNPENIQKDFKIREMFLNNDINKSIYEYYNNIIEKEDFESKKNKNIILIDKEIQLLENSLKKTEDNLDLFKEEKYLYYGELLKSNLYKVKYGDKIVSLYDYDKEKEIEIELDEYLTPSQNVEIFFNRYKKSKEGRVRWLEQKDKILSKYENYSRLKEILVSIKNNDELINFENNYLSGKINKILNNKKNDEKKSYGRVFNLSDGYVAYVSRSSKNADEILNKVAKGADYWFHIRDYAGSHVIVKEIKNKEITEKIKKEAALLALYYSKGKKSDDGDIYFTRVKYLHKAKGSGVVLPTQEKNIKVKFDENILKSIIGED
ncbi:MAG TPA: NFACT RNA binding domain-containing protein [Spirochaetota bacterium]|nr:NFACT RNA binding domain-containing protein [Spirochaetota bacterium]